MRALIKRTKAGEKNADVGDLCFVRQVGVIKMGTTSI